MNTPSTPSPGQRRKRGSSKDPKALDATIESAASSFAKALEAGAGSTTEAVVAAYADARSLFRGLLRRAGYAEESISALLTKFNDAGPRSAPWKPVSSRVPGRPQDGKDGNRIQRWNLPADHKFYASQRDGTLVGIKYILQALSMTGAPETPEPAASVATWLLTYVVKPGAFRDPIQKCEVHLKDFVAAPRVLTSGHIVPLDRGGRHVPDNTTLLLKESNDLQGNRTIPELLALIRTILSRSDPA